MANPTPSLQDRLLRLVQTLQFAWFCGHVSVLFFTLRYALFYITMKSYYYWARFSYRVAFASAFATYCIVVYKGYRARVRQGKPTGVIPLIADENVQYLMMALVWLLSKQVPLALLPFVVYSIFHVATYIRGNIIPAINPSPAAAPTSPSARPRPTGPFADAIGRFIKEYYDSSMTLVAALELALWFRLLGSAILFQRGSWILILLYSVFLRARFAQSSFVQSAVANLGARLDSVLANQSMNPQVRSAWEQAKNGLKRLADTTDAQRYVSTAKPDSAKKAQ